MTLPSPYDAADLPYIRFDQSGDIVFLACSYNTAPFVTVGYQQQMIERRAADSWSIVLYKTDDGPFGLVPTSNVRLKPSNTFGNVTLTADGDFFTPQMVGCLFQLTHSQFATFMGVGGDGYYSDVWEVNGIQDTERHALDKRSRVQLVYLWHLGGHAEYPAVDPRPNHGVLRLRNTHGRRRAGLYQQPGNIRQPDLSD